MVRFVLIFGASFAILIYLKGNDLKQFKNIYFQFVVKNSEIICLYLFRPEIEALQLPVFQVDV